MCKKEYDRSIESHNVLLSEAIFESRLRPVLEKQNSFIAVIKSVNTPPQVRDIINSLQYLRLPEAEPKEEDFAALIEDQARKGL